MEEDFHYKKEDLDLLPSLLKSYAPGVEGDCLEFMENVL
jgi:hypothetical protein